MAEKETIGAGETGGTRGTKEMGARMYESQQKELERQRKEYDAFIESQLSDNRGGKDK